MEQLITHVDPSKHIRSLLEDKIHHAMHIL
ncbi:hypothetical protein Goklo_013477, partial [Gossypium klotzschianum]|nr:hypothetical protein [Gossypium klotzschianum]